MPIEKVCVFFVAVRRESILLHKKISAGLQFFIFWAA